MKKKILLTRPASASERWAMILAQQGFDCMIEPLLTIEPTFAKRPAGAFQAVLITSARALDAGLPLAEACADLLRLPCFCVGAATGAAARAAGFVDVHCGAADGAALARQVVAALKDKTRSVLHLANEAAETAAQKILSENGFTVTLWPVYRARETADFTLATKEAFVHGDIAAIPVFSPRSARVLISLIEKRDLSNACRKIVAIGLSQAVSDVLQQMPWRRLRVAASPEEKSVLTCLQSELFND